MIVPSRSPELGPSRRQAGDTCECEVSTWNAKKVSLKSYQDHVKRLLFLGWGRERKKKIITNIKTCYKYKSVFFLFLSKYKQKFNKHKKVLLRFCVPPATGGAPVLFGGAGQK